VDPRNASSTSPASPSPNASAKAISPHFAPRFLRCLAKFLALPEPVALGWGCLAFRSGWLRFLLVPRGIALRIISGLRDHDTIPVTHIRNERHNTTILLGTTTALGAGGELDGQLLRTLASRVLGDMSQYEDKLHDGQCVHYHRW
jgi:hypothetical protein